MILRKKKIKKKPCKETCFYLLQEQFAVGLLFLYASLLKHQSLLWSFGNEQFSHFYINVCLIAVNVFFFFNNSWNLRKVSFLLLLKKSWLKHPKGFWLASVCKTDCFVLLDIFSKVNGDLYSNTKENIIIVFLWIWKLSSIL